MAPDPTTSSAILAGIRERAEGPMRKFRDVDASQRDVPLLLAAAEAALKHHQPVNRGEGLEPICGTCHRGFWPCPTYRDITAALAGEEAGDGA